MYQPKYDEDFKKNIVSLYQSGKTQSQLSKDYGISISAVSRWIKLYSEVKIDDDTIWTIVNKVDKKIKKEPTGVKRPHACRGVGSSSPKVLNLALRFAEIHIFLLIWG